MLRKHHINSEEIVIVDHLKLKTAKREAKQNLQVTELGMEQLKATNPGLVFESKLGQCSHLIVRFPWYNSSRTKAMQSFSARREQQTNSIC